MSDGTGIEWTDATWNPVRGCTKVSPGCKHCYAETFAERWRGTPGHAYEQGFDLRLVPSLLDQPLRWTRPRLVFVNSMSDLFHVGVPVEYVADVFDVMAAASWHTFQVLTKRADRMRAFSVVREGSPVDGNVNPPSGNVWLGVSVEDRKYGVPRIEELRQTVAAVRFLSIEPLLEDLGDVDLSHIDWAIVGGESGAGARPIDPVWVRRLRDQCSEHGVAFFFKQWGGLQKKIAGRLLDGVTHDAMPTIKQHAIPPLDDRRRALRFATAAAQRWAVAR
jgi:protein gp37